MKKLRQLTLLLGVFVSLNAWAQDNNYDALARTFSQTGPTGSARFQAIGGTHAALGADPSTLVGNPAGLGFYTRSEVNLTLGTASQKNSSDYLGTTKTDSKGNFNLGNLGIIFAGNRVSPVGSNRWRGAFGFGYTRSFNLNDAVMFGGLNRASSLTDSFANLANTEQTGGTPVSEFRDDLNSSGNTFDYPTSMYYYGYLIDPTTQNGPPYTGTEPGKSTNQAFNFNASGATSQWTAAYGASLNDKLYLGASIGLGRVNYTTTKSMREDYVSPVQIAGFTHENTLTTKGGGVNFSAGFIYRPNDFIRFGASVNSPTWYNINETTGESLSRVDLVKPIDVAASNVNDPSLNDLLSRLRNAGYNIGTQNGRIVISSIPRLSVKPFDANYQLRSPFKANGGIALFFGKNAFLSGNVEYVAYGGMKLSSTDTYSDYGLHDGTYTTLVKREYQNVLNYKVGGEYRIQHISLRAGFSYYSDPYKGTFDNLNRSRTVYSAGIGYKTDKFYVDLAGLMSQSTSAYSPYTLPSTSDYASAKINTVGTQGIISVGTYF